MKVMPDTITAEMEHALVTAESTADGYRAMCAVATAEPFPVTIDALGFMDGTVRLQLGSQEGEGVFTFTLTLELTMKIAAQFNFAVVSRINQVQSAMLALQSGATRN